MEKKAQVTLFVILGIVIIASIGISIYLSKGMSKAAVESEAQIMASLPPEIAEIRKSVADCSQAVFEKALVEAGKYGGYNSPLENSLDIADNLINYGYFEGQKTLPSLEQVKADIAEYVTTFLPDCVDLAAYDKFSLQAKAPVATIDFAEGKAIATVDYALSGKNAGASFKIDKPYRPEANVKFLSVYSTASKAVDLAAENPNEVNIDALLDLGEDINVVPIDEKTVVYSIQDKDSKLTGVDGEQSLIFVFATKAK